MAKVVSSKEESSFTVIVEAETMAKALEEAANLGKDPKTQGYPLFRVQRHHFSDSINQQWELQWYGTQGE